MTIHSCCNQTKGYRLTITWRVWERVNCCLNQVGGFTDLRLKLGLSQPGSVQNVKSKYRSTNRNTAFIAILQKCQRLSTSCIALLLETRLIIIFRYSSSWSRSSSHRGADHCMHAATLIPTSTKLKIYMFCLLPYPLFVTSALRSLHFPVNAPF